MSSPEPEITQLLNRAAQGDAEAARRVFPHVYRELKRLAAAKGRGFAPSGTLQTTALVHEAYLRMVGRHPEGWAGARHFYFTAARAMRDILVEHARARGALKRGSGLEPVSLEGVALTLESEPDQVLAIDAALARLADADPEGHQLVMLRFFTGLSMPEAAEVMEVPLRTLERKWRFLRAWLARELGEPGA